MEVVFGVKTGDLEQAREWVERATGLEARPRDSSDLGGDYYRFMGQGDEEILLVSNTDIYDGEPIFTETNEWKIAIALVETKRESPVFRGLESNTDQFVKLKEDDGED